MVLNFMQSKENSFTGFRTDQGKPLSRNIDVKSIKKVFLKACNLMKEAYTDNDNI